MKTFIRFSIWIAILMVATVVCEAQNRTRPSGERGDRSERSERGDRGNRSERGDREKRIGIRVKSGNMAFKITEKGQERNANFIFDDYGASFRIEWGNESTIVDAATKKAYNLNHTNKTYSEANSFAALLSLYLFTYVGDDPIAKEYQDYKKLPNRTIADKNCKVFSYTQKSATITLGGWRGLLFLNEDSGKSFIATSFTETIPENSFTVPPDYQFVENEIEK